MQPTYTAIAIIAGIVGIIGVVYTIVESIEKKLQNKLKMSEVIRPLIITTVIVALIASVGMLVVFANGSPPRGGVTATPTTVSTPPATSTPTPNTNSTSVPTGLAPLKPQEVQSWCYTLPNGGTCDISHFVQFRRADGVVLPYAVQMLAEEPVGIKLPPGFTAYVWDCYHGQIVHGPQDLKQVCTMKVARGTQVPD
jgi:hypothetical protein